MAAPRDLLAQIVQVVFLLWSCLVRGVYLLACSLEPPKPPPELPVVTPSLTSAPTFEDSHMLGAGVELRSQVVELLKERQCVCGPPGELKISSSALGRSKRLKSRSRAEKWRHADKRMIHDLFASPAPEADISVYTPFTPGGMSEDSSVYADFDPLFSPCSMTSSQSEYSPPSLTLSRHFSPASDVSSYLGSTKPEALSPPYFKINVDIGELGRRRGFTGKPILTNFSNTKHTFCNVLSPFTLGSWTPNTRSRLSTITNSMRPLTPQANVQDALPVKIQETITRFDPFSDGVDSFFVSEPIVEIANLNNLKAYLAPSSIKKTDAICWGYRVRALPGPKKRMETTIYDMSIYTAAKQSKLKVAKAKGKSRVKAEAESVKVALTPLNVACTSTDTGLASYKPTGNPKSVSTCRALSTDASLPALTKGPGNDQDLFDPLGPCNARAVPFTKSYDLVNSTGNCADLAAGSIKAPVKPSDGQEKSRTFSDILTPNNPFSGRTKSSPTIFCDAAVLTLTANSCKASESKITPTYFPPESEGLSEPPYANPNTFYIPPFSMSANNLGDSSVYNQSSLILNTADLGGKCDISAGHSPIRRRNRISRMNMRCYSSSTSFDNNSIRSSVDSLSTSSIYSTASMSTPDEPEYLSMSSSPTLLRGPLCSNLALPIRASLSNTNAESEPLHSLHRDRPFSSFFAMPIEDGQFAASAVNRKSHRKCHSKNLDDIIAMLDGFNFDTLGDSPQKFENCTFADQDFVVYPGIAF